MLTKRFGKNTGGIITVDPTGRFGIAYNTRSMPTARRTMQVSWRQEVRARIDYYSTSLLKITWLQVMPRYR